MANGLPSELPESPALPEVLEFARGLHDSHMLVDWLFRLSHLADVRRLPASERRVTMKVHLTSYDATLSNTCSGRLNALSSSLNAVTPTAAGCDQGLLAVCSLTRFAKEVCGRPLLVAPISVRNTTSQKPVETPKFPLRSAPR
jgi:hypothetical protein